MHFPYTFVFEFWYGNEGEKKEWFNFFSLISQTGQGLYNIWKKER